VNLFRSQKVKVIRPINAVTDNAPYAKDTAPKAKASTFKAKAKETNFGLKD